MQQKFVSPERLKASKIFFIRAPNNDNWIAAPSSDYGDLLRATIPTPPTAQQHASPPRAPLKRIICLYNGSTAFPALLLTHFSVKCGNASAFLSHRPPKTRLYALNVAVESEKWWIFKDIYCIVLQSKSWKYKMKFVRVYFKWKGATSGSWEGYRGSY